MKRRMKRLLSLFLVLALCLGMITFPAEAAEVVASGTCGENLTWTLTDDGTLTISGMGEMTDYDSNNNNFAPWHDQRGSITYVVIETDVTRIGNYAFYQCNNLTSIDISNSVIDIGNYAFWNCNGLVEINIPDSIVSIGDCAFRYCGNLVSINIPDSVVSIGNTSFSDCSSLTSIDIPNSITGLLLVYFKIVVV